MAFNAVCILFFFFILLFHSCLILSCILLMLLFCVLVSILFILCLSIYLFCVLLFCSTLVSGSKIYRNEGWLKIFAHYYIFTLTEAVCSLLQCSLGLALGICYCGSVMTMACHLPITQSEYDSQKIRLHLHNPHHCKLLIARC